MATVAERLKQLRKENRQTQVEVAQVAICRPATISRYESGKNEPPLEILAKLARHFCVSFSFLIGVTDNREWGIVQNTITEDKISKFLSGRIRELRIKEGMLQEDIGHLIGCKYTAVCNYESGRNKPSVEKLIILSKFFNVPVEYIIGLTDNQVMPCDKKENGICIPFPKVDGQEKNALQHAKEKAETKTLSDLRQFAKHNLLTEKEGEFLHLLQTYTDQVASEAFKTGSEFMAASIVSEIPSIQDEII